MHRGIEVFISTHNKRIIAAHFQGENFLRVCRELLMQIRAGLRTSRKEQSINARMSCQRHAGVAPALQQIEHARRQARHLPQFHGGFGTGGGKFAGLEYHAIAGDKRGNNMAVR